MNSAASTTPPAGASLDPLTAEFLRYTLLSIPKQIDTNITRTAYSPMIYEYKDYAVGLVDHLGRLIAQDGGGPVFVANALGIAVRDGREIHGPGGFQPGDIVLTNHSGTQGQHLNNVVAYTPVFTPAGSGPAELFAFMAVVLHWIDLGGMSIGSCTSPHSKEIFHEGIQLRHVKLWSRGQPCNEIYRTIEANTRLPRELMGDIEAQVAGCLHGRDLLSEVLNNYGATAVRQAIELMWQRSDHAARAVVSAIPDGIYEASSVLDDDPADPGHRLQVQVKVTVAADQMDVDFTGTAAQSQAPINSGREGGALVAARLAFKYLAIPTETANEGTFRALTVTIPDRTLISASEHAPMGQYSSILPTIIDTVLWALVSAVPAGLGGGHHASFGGFTLSGTHPQTGELFMSLDALHGGWGAGKDCDGPGPYKTMVQGDTLDVPVEPVEGFYPVRVESYGFYCDSGGAGEFRGGNGVEKVLTALAPCDLLIVLNRTQQPAWGVLGGQNGAAGVAYVERADQEPLRLVKGVAKLQPGDRVRIRTGGGGGYGKPEHRDPQLVARDVRCGFVSRRAAEREYHVVLDENHRVLADATAALRQTPSGPIAAGTS